MANEARINGDLRVTGNLTVNGTTPSVGRSGITQDAGAIYPVPMSSMRVHDATATLLPGTSSSDDLGYTSGTLGTDSPKLTTGDVATTTTTRYARFEYQLPAEYDDGETVTLRLSAGMETTISDGTATVDAQVYASDRELGVGADLCATVAWPCNLLVFANYDFTITATALSAGDILDIRLAFAVSDTATGTAVIGSIGAVEFLLDIKG